MSALKRKPYFYLVRFQLHVNTYQGDAQLKRMLVQLMSCFSGYTVKTGNQRNGESEFLDVPIIYGDMSRVAGYIMGPRGDQDNSMSSLPVMALYMTSLKQSQDRRLAPQHTERYNYIERAKDPDGKLLTGEPGKKKTVERFMPVPYEMGIEVSIWASNNDQGYQLVEQIATVFNPDMEIQLSNSPADWIFMTSLIFTGDIDMEKVVPSGGDTDPLYVFRMSFNTTVWMSPPAKVYDTKHIYSIHVPILELEESLDFDAMGQLDGLVIEADDDDIVFFESLGPGMTPSSI